MRYNAIADVVSVCRIEVVDVTRKFIPPDTDDLIRRYVGGDSLKEVAEALGVSDDYVRGQLVKAGVPRRQGGGVRHDRVIIDDAAMVRRYEAGESEKALAVAFHIDRNGIRRRLLKAGVTPRGRSDAMYLRMSQASAEERARLAAAAHDAVRGKPHSKERLAAKALGIEKLGANGPNVSAAEIMLACMLRNAGRDVVHQKAIGPYNVDLAAGSVAVEVLGGQWHRAKKHRERLRYILNAGRDVIYVWVDGRNHPLGAGAAEYVVAHLEFRDGNPAAPRCYRVIRGGGQFVAEGSADGDDLPEVLPISDRPDVPPAEVPFGYCHCGCGGLAPVAAKSRPGRGQVKGQPIRYISGHNKAFRRDAS
jgi:hypothetical protein